MPIYDQSYRRIEGTRSAGRFRFLPIAAFGLRLFFRRKRFILLGVLALAPFAIGMFLLSVPHFLPTLLESMPPEIRSNLHVTSATLYLFLANPFAWMVRMVFTIFAGGGLIANDLRVNALEVYFSRPITRLDYLLGKLLVIMAILLLLTLAPALVLWLYDVMLATEDGFLVKQLPLVPRIIGASLALTLPFALLMLAISSISRSARVAMIVFAALFLMLAPVAAKLSDALENKWIQLIQLRATADRAMGDLLGTPAQIMSTFRQEAPLLGVDAWAPLALLAGVMAVSLVVLFRRIRPVEVVAG